MMVLPGMGLVQRISRRNDAAVLSANNAESFAARRQ